jgi:hypothetical protein
MSVSRETNPVEPAGPFDPWDSPYWDVWHYTLPDAELEAIDAENFAAACDERDAPAPWPTEEEKAEYERWQDQAEASRDFYRRNGSFGDWLTTNGGPA